MHLLALNNFAHSARASDCISWLPLIIRYARTFCSFISNYCKYRMEISKQPHGVCNQSDEGEGLPETKARLSLIRTNGATYQG